jgi:NAD(P)-dependent dehydrogenase (short-subunit alcohol dehydrogenase family)
MKRLQDKVVFITGGNSGIGKASALEAAREGARVVIADLPTKDHQQTILDIEALGAPCMFVPIDVSDVESVKKAITATVEKYVYSGIHDMSEVLWDTLIAVNLTGQFYCVKYELQQFLKQGGGVIVNMSSLGGLKAEHGLVPYTVAKHGVLGLTKNIAVQYGHQNIRGNAICPYYVETPLLGAAPKEVHQAWIDGTPAKRLCTAEEVAKTFIFLACDDSSYCNGTQIILDGGVLA